MAYSLFGERPVAAAAFRNPVQAFFAAIAAARARGASHKALQELLNLDAALLDDLGIVRADVVAALKQPGAAGASLEKKRARRAREWFARR